MPELEPIGWIVVGLCAVMVGVAKTGVPGFAILVVPLMAGVLPARSSTGVVLGILILGDLFAVAYHRHNAKWVHVARLLPAAVFGIIAGYFAMKHVSDAQLKPIIGIIVLVMLAITYWRNRARSNPAIVPNHPGFALLLGFVAGLTTMMANAAGPVMTVYLLAMRLPKVEFVGTSAWFFFAVNWIKVPFSSRLGFVSAESLKLNLLMLPFIALGALAGVYLLKRIGQKAFDAVVQILAAAAAVKLLF